MSDSPDSDRPAGPDEEGSGRGLKVVWQRANLCATAITMLAQCSLYVVMERGRAGALGVLLGGLAGLIRFRLRYRALSGGKVGVSSLVGARMLGYFITAAALGAAFAWSEEISPWAAVGGTLIINFCIVAFELADSLRRRAGTEGQNEN